jgi:hypothetical protein
VFLLYLLTYIQLNGPYSEALSKSREAAFIQSGIKSDYDLVNRAAVKKVPKGLYWAGSAGVMAYRKEVRFKSKHFGTWSASKDKIQVTWGVSW